MFYFPLFRFEFLSWYFHNSFQILSLLLSLFSLIAQRFCSATSWRLLQRVILWIGKVIRLHNHRSLHFLYSSMHEWSSLFLGSLPDMVRESRCRSKTPYICICMQSRWGGSGWLYNHQDDSRNRRSAVLELSSRRTLTTPKPSSLTSHAFWNRWMDGPK